MRGFFYIILFIVISITNSDFSFSEPLRGRAAGSVPKDSIWDSHWKFRKNILKSSPEIDLEYYIYGELGNEENMIDSLRRGRVQISSSSLWGLSSTIPEVAVLALPYLFENVEEADYFYDCCAGEIIQPYLEPLGIAFLGWSEAGWTSFYGPKSYLSPKDLIGQKLRTPFTPSVAIFLKSLEADTIFLGIRDVLPALQTGMVEGGASSLPWFASAFKDYAPHYTLTKHHYETTVIMASKKWLEKATPVQLDILNKAFKVFSKQRLSVRQDANRNILELKDNGINIYDLTSVQKERWVSESRKLHPVILKEIGGDAISVYEKVKKIKMAFKETRN